MEAVKRRVRDAHAALKNLDRSDARLLAAALALVCCVWAFFWVADQVTGTHTQHLDDKVIAHLREPGRPGTPIGPSWLPDAMRDLTALGSTPVIAFFVLATAGALLARRQFHAFSLLMGASLGGVVLILLLKDVFERPRPDLALRLVHAGSTSFPSGHALESSVAYLTLAALLSRLVRHRGLKLYFIGLALFLTGIVGATRVYLGVHYPSDVLGGWIAGLTWALTCWTVASYLQRRGSVEPPQ
jgi:undecaprenyl-diphosphatase